MAEKFPAVDWAVISAVPEQQLDHARLKEFFFWLVSNLNTHTDKHGGWGLKFSLSPRKVVITAGESGKKASSKSESGKDEPPKKAEEKKGTEEVDGAKKGEGSKEKACVALSSVEKPKKVTEDVNSSRNRTKNAYKTIRDDFPSVIVIFHVLPGPDSEEYEWMKIFATEYGFVRQGIQKENVLTRFQSVKADPDQIYNNMVTWCEKSIEILALGGIHNPSGLVRSCTLVITVPRGDGGVRSINTDFYPQTAPIFPGQMSPMDLEDSVSWCLHGVRSLIPPVPYHPLQMSPEGAGNGMQKPPEFAYQKSRGFGMGSITSTETAHEFTHETDVCIQGLPEKLTQYEVACIFHEFRVKGLRLGLDARSAYVRLGTKFEAVQAAETLDGSAVNEAFTVSVEPCNPYVQQEMRRSLAQPLIIPKSQRNPINTNRREVIQ